MFFTKKVFGLLSYNEKCATFLVGSEDLPIPIRIASKSVE